MAAPTLLGSGGNAAASTQDIISLTASATVGGLVLACFMVNASDLSGVSDSVGNTWTLVKSDVVSFPNTYIYKTVQNVGRLFSAQNVTITTSASHGKGTVLGAVLDVPGYLSTVDKTASQEGTGTLNRVAGTTATTTSVNEILIAAFGTHVTETAFTPGAGYTSIFSSPAYLTDATGGNVLEVIYQEVTATGAYSPTGTGGASGNTTGVTATFASTTQPSAGGNSARRFGKGGAVLLDNFLS